MQADIDKQIYKKNDEIAKILNKVYEHFKEGLFDKSIDLLEEALKMDFDFPGVASALKCASYWKEKMERLEYLNTPYETGEFFISHWRQFSSFTDSIGETNEKCLYNLKQFVFTSALKNFMTLLSDSEIYDSDVLLKIGRCHKNLGNYEKAIDFLEIANQQKNSAADIIAELADCYSLINETRISKAFFREAFFLDPESIDLSLFESGMIAKLIEKMKEKGIGEDDLREWIPVYGVIYGVFNIKRELRPIEYGKLKQSIFHIERELESNPETANKLTPRLINRYFWLIDHLVIKNEDKQKIEEVLNKIKELDINIYKEYTH